MQALILAGGLGTRLAPLTDSTPKPMIDVNGKPFLWHQLTRLQSEGFTDVIISTGYLSHIVEEYFKYNPIEGLSITFSKEDTPLGSGGALVLAKKYIKGDILVLNGDDYPVLDWSALKERIKTGKSFISIQKSTLGNVEIDTDSGLVKRYLDKNGNKGSDWRHSGLGYISRDDLNLVDENMRDLEGQFLALLSQKGRLYYLESIEPTISIGTHEDLALARTKLHV